MQKKSLARSLLWILKYPSLRRFAFLACHSLYFHSVASSFNLTSGESNFLYLVLSMKWSFRPSVVARWLCMQEMRNNLLVLVTTGA
jgi:hypothetical protein